ncbi:hypothetical protein AHAS_Ahas14G0126500 [Arachis hypogaea]
MDDYGGITAPDMEKRITEIHNNTDRTETARRAAFRCGFSGRDADAEQERDSGNVGREVVVRRIGRAKRQGFYVHFGFIYRDKRIFLDLDFGIQSILDSELQINL